MRTLRAWLSRLGGLFGRQRRDRELAEEIESHLRLHIDDNIRAGMSPAEARRAAILAFGAVESIKETYRDRRGLPLLDGLARDVGWAVRVLRRDPGFAVLAVLTLALGIAATTAVFSIVDGVLLRPLPYPEPERLVAINTVDTERPERFMPVSELLVGAMRDRATLLEIVVGYQAESAPLVGAGEPMLVNLGHAGEGFFELFGGSPLLGRAFVSADHISDAERVVVLSHTLWQSIWGGDPEIVDRSITLSDESHVVIGVMPAGFRSPEALRSGSLSQADADAWVPLVLGADNNLQSIGVGRLTAGATIEAAGAELDPIVAAASEGLPMNLSGRLTPLQARTVGEVGTTLAVFLGAALLLLLIACANVAYLLLSRGVQRRSELVLRTALGAHRGRVARQLLVESLLLAALGGAAGTALAHAFVGIFRAADPGTIPRFAEVVIDGPILGFVLLLASLTGIVFGVAPALQLSRNNPSLALREGAAGYSDGRPARRLRSALVVTQTALAVVLLVGAGLLVNSFVRLATIDAGFDPSGLATIEIRAPVSFAERARAAPFFAELLEHTRALPGVDAAALASVTPYIPAGSWALVPEGWEQTPPRDQPFIRATTVSAGYPALMRIPLVAGRAFEEDDRPGAAAVALVNETFVRTYWPGEDPIGKRIGAGFGMLGADSLTVIGVVGDVRARPASAAVPEVFALAAQQPWHTMSVVARTSGDPADLIAPMRRAVWAIDPDLPVRRAATMEEITSDLVAGSRFYALLSSSFAGAALVLALVGVYGTAAHAAGRRTRELSIRVALGAQAAAILGMVVRDALLLAVVGVVAGAVASRLVVGALSDLLFGVTGGDVSTLAACAVLFIVASCLASLLPALRVARTDAAAALRADK